MITRTYGLSRPLNVLSSRNTRTKAMDSRDQVPEDPNAYDERGLMPITNVVQIPLYT